MKRIVWIALLIVMLALGQPHPSPVRAANPVIGAATGELLIQFRADQSAAEQERVIGARGGQIVDRIPALHIAVVRFIGLMGADAGATAALLAELQSAPGVAAVEPNTRYHAATTGTNDQPLTVRIHLPLVVTGPGPADPLASNQYAWERIQAYPGWTVTQGNSDVVIAIVDSGIAVDHPDLGAKLVPGYDFVATDDDPDDGNGHGTHVAGIAGAITNNGIGVAGTCPACRLMPVRVLDDSNGGTLSNVAKGIVYAVDHGAQVINLSLVGSSSSTLRSAIEYAWTHGAVLACAAGNANTDSTTYAYPAAYPECIAVGATTSTDERWDAFGSGSNYGDWVDVAAPGAYIYSTWNDGGYAAVSGTSMATPHVAGVAGLLAAQGLTNTEIRTRIERNADPISGTGMYWNNGRLNLLRAVRGF